MSKNSDNVRENEKPGSQQSSLTPAVLGIPSGSHGAKLPMVKKDKEQLLAQLELWRQARRVELISSIMSRRKPPTAPKISSTVRSKIKTTSNAATAADGKGSQSDGKKSVFDRLYESGYKQILAKQSQETKNEKPTLRRKPQNVKPPKSTTQDRGSMPKIIVTGEAGNTESSLTTESTDLPSSVQEKEKDVPLEDETKSPDSATELEQTLVVVDEDSGDGCRDDQTPSVAGENATSLGSSENENVNQSVDAVKSVENVDVCESVKQPEEVKRQCEVKKSEAVSKVKSFKSPPKSSVSKPRAPLRRSISLIFRTKSGNYESAIHRTKSENNVSALGRCGKLEVDVMKQNQHEVGPSKKDAADKLAVKKRSVCFQTPTHKGLSASHLRSKLENWLTEKGHSIDTYRHLGCFGLAAEGTPVARHFRQPKLDDSSNASFYSTAPNTPIAEVADESDKENVTPPVFVPRVDVKDVEGWLGDLFRLIVQVKYPTDRCEEWLNAILRKYPNCTNLSIYWECLAAMGGGQKHVKPETITGDDKAEESDAGNSLADILDKLVIDKNSKSASKIERGLSEKNIFRSKTVKFAIKEEKVKSTGSAVKNEAHEKVLVATPVRRSARIQTPDKSNIISSLKSLDPKTRSRVSFKPNDALLN